MAGGNWIKLYRSIRSHWLWEDGNERYLKWWLDILMMVNHEPRKIPFNGELKTINRSEKQTSILKLASRWDVNRKTVTSFLNLLVADDMIEIKKSRQTGTTIKVLHYNDYQDNSSNKGQQTGHQTGQQTGHKQETKELKDKILSSSTVPVAEIVEYLNQKTGKHFTTKAAATKKKINARWKEGHGLDEFKKVIDVKSADWLGQSDMVQYLRPETLFGTKFEAYLNEQPTGKPAAQQESKSERIKRLQKFVADQHANGSTPDEIQSMVAELGANLSIEKINKIIEMEDES